MVKAPSQKPSLIFANSKRQTKKKKSTATIHARCDAYSINNAESKTEKRHKMIVPMESRIFNLLLIFAFKEGRECTQKSSYSMIYKL